MSARVTGAELKEIVDTDKTDSVLETQFIDTATKFIDEYLLDKGISDDWLAKIELYLAAHFLTITDERGGLVVEHLGDATDRYADVYEGGLKLTRYGLQAIALDPSQTLSAFDAKKKAEFRVV